MYIQVKATEGHRGELAVGPRIYKCALGKSGVTSHKAEGDHASPAGLYPIRAVYYRADRVPKPDTAVNCHKINKTDGWCDDPAHPSYNKKITLPFAASHETLTREDTLYDIVVVLGHNDDPPVPGRGSCIFMHIAREGYTGTEGCIALSLQDMQVVLTSVCKDTSVQINAD